jgi:hypothetical protein
VIGYIAPAAVAPVTTFRRETSFEAILNLLLFDKAGEAEWRTKTGSQGKAIIKIFQGFLKCTYGVRCVEDITQHHLDGFDGMLKAINPQHGKASADQALEPKAYFQKYMRDYAGIKHLSAKTRNRYWVFVRQFLARAKKNGVQITTFDLQDFRVKIKNINTRTERIIPKLNFIQALMHLPPLTGCAGFDHRKNGKASPMFTAGDQIYHRAAYFGVIIAHYHGLRRDEFCGLATDDVIDIDGIPCLHIRENKFRQIKNHQSDRKHALHPELIRLGFLDYVAKIRTLKYEMAVSRLKCNT